MIIISGIALGQVTPHDYSNHGIIDTSKNVIVDYSGKNQLEPIFRKLNSLALYGQGQVNILHLGDSHIQADYFSGQMRHHFSNLIKGGEASRGFVFPYKMAQTNNPANYSIWYSGKWDFCKNTQKSRGCNLGLSGIMVKTYSPNARMTITQPGGEHRIYKFNRVKVFHTVDTTSFSIRVITDAKIIRSHADAKAGFTEFILDRHLDTLRLEFSQYLPRQINFELHGISLESTDGGITYSATGINGADVPAWLACPLLDKQLASLDLDLVIISLGTNDGYNTHFSSQLYAENMDALIKRLKVAAPKAKILLTTPGDNYRYNRELNINTLKTQQILDEIARRHGCLLWDFHTLMGGLNSITLWNREGLSAKDRIHFSKAGYLLQGDMLFSALMKKYDRYMENNVRYVVPDTLPVKPKQAKTTKIDSVDTLQTELKPTTETTVH